MSLYDFSQYESAINEAESGKILPDNTEVVIRFIGTREGTSTKTGENRDYLILRFDVPEEPAVFDIEYFLWAPSAYPSLDPKQLNSAQVSARNVAKALGLDLTRPINWEDHIGKETCALIGVDVDKTGDFRDKNRIKRFV